MYKSQHVITSRHYLVICMISFATGIFIATKLGFFKAFVFLFATVSVCFTVFCLFLILTQKAFPIRCVILTFLIALFALLGIFRLFVAENPSTNPIASYNSTEGWVYGTVSSEPRYVDGSYSYSFELDVFRINDDDSAKGTVIMYIPQNRGCNVTFGDTVRCWTELSGSTSHTDNLNEDYYTRLKGRNIFLSGKTKNLNILNKDDAITPTLRIKNAGNSIRTKICNAADILLGTNPQNTAILKGILTGDKSGFNDTLYTNLSNSGISHIVAVSGLHISILFSFLIFIMSGLNLKSRLRLLAVIPFIVLFMAVSSFTPSVCRASAMMLIMILSSFFGRDYDPVTSLAFALGCILTLNPYALFSKSLVLSFSATLGIFIYFKYFNRALLHPLRKHSLHRNPSKAKTVLFKGYTAVSASLSLSFASFLGTAYFLAVFFGKISKIQFLTNLWVVPVVFIVFCLGYISCITYYVFPWLATAVLRHPLILSVEIISCTANTFGSDQYAFEIYSDGFSGIHTIIYFSSLYILYMTFKAIHDIRIEKRLRAERAKTLTSAPALDQIYLQL